MFEGTCYSTATVTEYNLNMESNTISQTIITIEFTVKTPNNMDISRFTLNAGDWVEGIDFTWTVVPDPLEIKNFLLKIEWLKLDRLEKSVSVSVTGLETTNVSGEVLTFTSEDY